MSPKVTYNLRAIVQAKIDSSNSADPRAIADALIDDGDISSSDYADALRLTLPGYVREMVRSDRAQTLSAVSATVAGSGAGTSAATSAPATQTSNGKPVRSGKQNQSARWNKTKVLGLRINLGGTKWIVLGDATPKDIDDAISEYTRRVAQNQAEADRYRKVRDLFKQDPNAKVVKDLDFAKLTQALA